MYFSAGGAGPAALATAPATASGLWPITITTRPAGLNLMTMFVPSSTTQMLSCGIDAHAVRELEAVVAFADLAHVCAVLIELEQPRVGAARVDEDMPFGIGRHADGFAHVHTGRHLQERANVGRDFRHILRLGLVLRERRTAAERNDDNETGREQSPHGASYWAVFFWAFRTNWYSGYVVSFPPRVASNGILNFSAYSFRNAFVPGRWCGIYPGG